MLKKLSAARSIHIYYNDSGYFSIFSAYLQMESFFFCYLSVEGIWDEICGAYSNHFLLRVNKNYFFTLKKFAIFILFKLLIPEVSRLLNHLNQYLNYIIVITRPCVIIRNCLECSRIAKIVRTD